MRTSFLLAASIAGVLTLASIDRSAEAQMQTPMQPGAKSPTAKPKGGKGPGQCGPMMYWKGGRCVDARSTKK